MRVGDDDLCNAYVIKRFAGDDGNRVRCSDEVGSTWGIQHRNFTSHRVFGWVRAEANEAGISNELAVDELYEFTQSNRHVPTSLDQIRELPLQAQGIPLRRFHPDETDAQGNQGTTMTLNLSLMVRHEGLDSLGFLAGVLLAVSFTPDFFFSVDAQMAKTSFGPFRQLQGIWKLLRPGCRDRNLLES